MRTRYLNNDYFTLPPSQRHETIPFLHLPVPRLPTPLSSAVDHHLNFYSPLPDVSLHIDPFPIHTALSSLLSSVLPHRIAVRNLDLSSSVADYPNCENALPSEADFIFEVEDHVSDADIEFSKESKTVTPSNVNEVVYEPFQFETPEQLDTLLVENVCFTEKERMQMLSHTSEVENSMEMFMSETLMQYPYQDLESVSRMEDVISEYLKEENGCALEGNISGQHLPYSDKKTFLILEVDEESLGIPTSLSMVDIVESYFGNLRPQNFDERYQSITEGRELLDSKVYDLVKLISEDCVSKKSLILPDLFPERDFLNMLENEHVDGALQADSDSLMNLITFQEFVFLDEDMINNTFEAFYDTKALNDLEASDWMSKKEFNFKSFDELIVSNEMALVDDPFKSLPVPVISDNKKMINVHDIIEELFSNLKTQPLSASDGIYLNWDLLEEDKCKYNISNWYQNIWAKIDLKNHDFRGKSFDNRKMIFDLVFFDDSIVQCDHKNSEELQNLLSDRISQLDNQPVEFSVSTLLEHGSSNKGCQEQLLGKNAQRASLLFKSTSDIRNLSDTTDKCDLQQNEKLQKLLSDSISQPVEFSAGKILENGSSNQGHQEQLPERNAERASLLLKSMSEISNLDYFLNPQKAMVKESCYFSVDSTNANVNIPKYTSTAFKPGLQSEGWHTVLHRVKLSDNIVALARYFGKSYLDILQSDTELTKTHKSDAHYFELLSLQKHKLIEFHVNGNNMAFIVLSAIKQAVWYLCFYGLNPAFLYLEKLCQNMGYLKSRLGILQSLIKDENSKMENNITMAHSSLTIIKEILQANIKHDSLKALIVAEEVFWWSLKNLLLSLRLSFGELNDSYRNLPYANNLTEDSDTKMMELLSSDCLLVSYKRVSPLFPFNKFGIILEHGGPNGSSRISEFSSNSVGLPNLHFLTVELNDHAILKALCQGVEMPPYTEMLPETETPLIFNHKESMVNRKLERLLNFYPAEKRHDIKSSKAALEAENFVPLIPAVKTEHDHQSLESFTGSVITVNTQNVDKEMIVSKRSSYQVILAMEKKGIQVVERDLDLPVDIILSPAVCLAWYDSTNLGKKATPATEASSSLPLCIDNIATDVLPLLSFYFCGCFLVFEGEFNFLSTVMEYSDGLYAAATSLGMDLQIFFSYSPELTNEIMINCIKSTAIQTRGLYSKIPDSVTLAEFFLMQFPGINPLTAQSILSLGVTLNVFLAWPHEQRIHVLEKYNVPEQSLSLLSVFCRYGEREDSKSIMTDCSSSVSSGPDSDRCRFYHADNKRKRTTPAIIDQNDELCFDELLQFETLNQVVEAVPNPSILQNPFDLGITKDAWRSRDSGKTSLDTRDAFCQKKKNIATTMRNHSRVSPSSWNCKAPQIFEQLEQPSFSLKNKELAQNGIMDNGFTGKILKWHNLGKFEKLHEGIRGEVVDLTNSPLLDENFSISDSMSFPNMIDETEKDHLRKNKIAKKLSFGNSFHPETNSIWRSMKDTGEVDHHAEPDFGKDAFPLDFNPHGNIDSTPARILGGLTFEEGLSYLSETPLSRVRRSATPLKHSPWTTEFINKVKEKSKLRQKSVLCGNSSSYFGYQGNISKASKKRSPSTLDSFRYQPSKTPGNTQEQKRQKQSGQSSNSAKKGRYPVPISSRTPNDKRSTMTLTFGKSTSGGQTKLIWSDKRKFPYQAQ